MAKDTFYFPHDFHSRTDLKSLRLIKDGWENYGIYWAIIEILHEQGGVMKKDYESIAYELRTNNERIKNVIENYGLFIVENDDFKSQRVLDNLAKRLEKSHKARESVHKRWLKYTNVIQTNYEGNTSKGKESKGKDSIVKRTYSKHPPKSAIFNDFFNLHLHYLNQKYISLNENKDINLLNKLVDELGDEDVRERLERFFKSKDKFVLENGFSVGMFYSQINKLGKDQKKDKWNDLN